MMQMFRLFKVYPINYFIKLRSVPFTKACLYFSSTILVIQLFIFASLIYFLENEDKLIAPPVYSCDIDILGDMKAITSAAIEIGANIVVLEKEYLHPTIKSRNKLIYKCTNHCALCKPLITIGMDYGSISEKSKRNKFLMKLIEDNFIGIVFYNNNPRQKVVELRNIEVGVFLQRTATFQICILHPREDNTWWIGDAQSDSSSETKLKLLNLTVNNLTLMKYEQAIDRFELISNTGEADLSFLYPKDMTTVLAELEHSKFIECNHTRSSIFEKKYGLVKKADAVRFRHKVWKMLSRVKIVLDSMGIDFWLSSGTALGYFRECNIIAHSKDVDIGVWASAYSDQIISEMHSHGFRLKISLGLPNDSLELSFVDDSGIKLDIFFFYKESDYYWNGGTQVKSGKKFKYKFPKFTLCWTIFKDLRVRIPCETEAYIQANYGPNWFVPVKTWDWKTSPSNVQPNGVWLQEQLSEAIKLFV